MEQSRIESAVEAAMNVGLGFFISLGVWIWIVVPIWNLPVRPADNLVITCVFTVTSLMRSYALRRFFNNGWHKVIKNVTRGVLHIRSKL